MNSNKENLMRMSSVRVICFDFDGVFTDNKVYVDEDGKESVACYRSDGIGLSRLSSLGMKIFVVSTEKNPVVSKRCKKLKINCYQAVENKVSVINQISEELSIPLSQFAFVGNDINDLGALKAVGVSIGVSDSYKEVLDICDYTCDKKGGCGAVREVCDMFINIKNNSYN